MRSLFTQFRPRALLGVLPVAVFLALRQIIGVEVAIVGGFGTTLFVYIVNRGEAGAILALSTLAIAISAVASVAALWWGEERLYFAGDPAWDFALALIALTSLAIRRPLTGLVLHEAIPSLRVDLDPRHVVYYVSTLLVGLLFLFHGVVRTSLLLSSDSIERYLILSRAVQWPTNLLMVLLVAWMLKRATARSDGADERTKFSSRVDA